MKKLYLLELLRFLAALCIFFGHYCHFYDYFKIPSSDGYFYKVNPQLGVLAVPIFFMMSGAIFTRNYEEKISKKLISFKNFALKRVARLYPLHFFTLSLVALLQFCIFSLQSEYFVYEINDLKHFFLNLFFISHWGFESGNSFNSPVWSVSHEIFIYIVFYLLCIASRYVNFLALNFLLIIFFIPYLQSLFSYPLLKSTFAFIVGAFVYKILYLIFANIESRRISLALGISLIILATYLEYSIYYLGLIPGHLQSHLISNGLPLGFLGPCILLTTITIDLNVRDYTRNGTKFLNFLGGISYSTYLLHFPIQLLFILFTLLVGTIQFQSWQILITYTLTVLFFATCSFYLFEKPMQHYILDRFNI